MPSYFLDSSALVKRHVTETGHLWVRSLCAPGAGNLIIAAELALVEVPASFARMARKTPRRISVAQRDRLMSEFEDRVRRHYEVVQFDRAIANRAVALCRKHPLRAYDAIQLASALTRRDDDLAAGLPAPIFVCADTTLLNAATS